MSSGSGGRTGRSHNAVMLPRMNVCFFGSSLVSAYWNGAATYYRGIIRAMHRMGHRITFYEPDAYDRQRHRDIDDPDYARVVVYDPEDRNAVDNALAEAEGADLVVKCSGVGVLDAELEAAIAGMTGDGRLTAFWDVDAPATLDRVQGDPADPFREHIPRYSLILTYGGGQPVIDPYEALGARRCVPIYNALDPDTHHPPRWSEGDGNGRGDGRAAEAGRFACDLAFLGNRLPDREARVEEFFFQPASSLPGKDFILGGSGWGDRPLPGNVRHVGHVYTADHNAFNAGPMAVLNISRESMARYGFSPATRVFEAAGAGACLITDAWEGIDEFFEPGEEILVAGDGEEVAELLRNLTADRAEQIGTAALRRALRDHTYARRAERLEQVLNEELA